MKHIPATRKLSAEHYGNTGHYYYYWPALQCVFRADCVMTFSDQDETIELDILEFLLRSLHIAKKRNRMQELAPRRHTDDQYGLDDHYYFYHGESNTVFKEKTRVKFMEFDDIIELTRAEYIELSIMYDQNQDDTLI